MSRRRAASLEHLVSIATALPWWASVGLAVASFAVARWLASIDRATLAAAPDASRAALERVVLPGAEIAQYALPVVFVLCAAIAIGRRLKRAGLHVAARQPEARRGVESPGPGRSSALSVAELETLTREVYGRQGFDVEEAVAAPDGGLSLVVRRGDRRFLVRCTHWRGPSGDGNPGVPMAGTAHESEDGTAGERMPGTAKDGEDGTVAATREHAPK